jgi:DNA-directed RNA polymerase specialized sigma24 family protein
MSADYKDPKSVELKLHKLCNAVMRRLAGASITIFQRDDIMQELWIAWAIACRNYDPASNVPFLAYLSLGMKQHINRVIEKHAERFSGQTYALSFDYAAPSEDGEGLVLSDKVASIYGTTESIEDDLAWKQAIALLSPNARIFATLLKDTPPEISEQVIHLREKSKHAATMGVSKSYPMRVTTRMIFDLLGCTTKQSREILSEISSLKSNVKRAKA